MLELGVTRLIPLVEEVEVAVAEAVAEAELTDDSVVVGVPLALADPVLLKVGSADVDAVDDGVGASTLGIITTSPSPPFTLSVGLPKAAGLT